MPFANVYFARAEDGPLPVSVSGTLAFQRRIFIGNDEAPNPDGWGLLLGASAFRRIDFTSSFAGIPELFVAYDLQSITWHSSQIAPAAGAGASPGQKTDYDNKPRILLRANMAFMGDKTTYTIGPLRGLPGRLCRRRQPWRDFLAAAPVVGHSGRRTVRRKEENA